MLANRPLFRANVRDRHGWPSLLLGVAGMVMMFAVIAVPFSSAAHAAVVSVSQCDGQGPIVAGATTIMDCDITVVNTIHGGVRSAVVTVSRTCALDACSGSTSSSYSDVVTSVDQCNESDNDAAHPINCHVSVTNLISADTPGAQPVTAATVNQCVGSGNIGCTPFPATTTQATVTQCNGSGTGGGGTVNCTVPGSTVSPAIPIMVNQCNGTGNPGGSVVTCSATIQTTITTAVAAPTTAAPSTTPPTGTPTQSVPTGSAPVTVAAAGTPTTLGGGGTVPTTTPTGTVASPQVALVPTGGIQAGGGSTAGLQHTRLLALSAGLWLAAGGSAILRRRRTNRRH